MRVYLDSDYKCLLNPTAGERSIDTEFFDGKCEEFVMGYRFIPAGEFWTAPNGSVIYGETAFPWRPYSELEKAQNRYELEQVKDTNKKLSNQLKMANEQISFLEDCVLELGDSIYA